MTRVTITEAKARLSELIDLAAAGDEVLITRRGVPVVRLVAERAHPPRRLFGLYAGQIEIGPDFDDPIPGFG